MKAKTLPLTLLFALCAGFANAQTADTLTPSVKYKKVFPGITLGWNYVGFSTAEAGFIIGLTNNSLKQTKAMTMIMHGPSFGCEMGNYENAFRVAPKVSYGYYTSFLAGRLSVVDFMKNDAHSFYVSPEAGLSFGSLLDFFLGANFLVSGNEIPDVSTFRGTLSLNLLFFYFKKEKSKKNEPVNP